MFFKASLSLFHTHRHLPSQALTQHSLISFHTHFLTKSKVRGWRRGEDAFTQFITGRPSLCCFCPRLTLYVVPCQAGAPRPVKLISLFRILSNTLNLRAHTHIHTHTHIHRHTLLWELSLWFTGNLYRESRTGTGSLAGHSRG